MNISKRVDRLFEELGGDYAFKKIADVPVQSRLTQTMAQKMTQAATIDWDPAQKAAVKKLSKKYSDEVKGGAYGEDIQKIYDAYRKELGENFEKQKGNTVESIASEAINFAVCQGLGNTVNNKQNPIKPTDPGFFDKFANVQLKKAGLTNVGLNKKIVDNKNANEDLNELIKALQCTVPQKKTEGAKK